MTIALAVLAVAFLLRAPITSVPPTLSTLRADLHLGPALAGATTSLPMVCFGLFAFAAPYLVGRLGLERAMLLLLVPIAAGALVRSAGGAAAFFLGTVLVGCGIALGNVLVPSFIRSRFPTRIALLMGAYTATLQISGALGSTATVPLEDGLGWGWPLALGLWAVPALAVLAWWVVIVRRTPGHDAGAVTPPTGLRAVATTRRAWAITAFMGLQSLIFYSLVTWLPDQLTAQGLSPAAAGAVLGLFSLLGIPGSFVAPRFATSRRARPWITAVCGVQIVALLCLGLGPAAAAVAASVCGLAQGAAFSSALTFVADQPDSADVPAVSALAQGVGYVVAATGPILLGVLFDATGSWQVPDLVLVGVLVVLVVLGGHVGSSLHRANAVARAAG
ncbi:MFS transporter [Mobilicoccus pelagius]|uniref:MFS transporter n=1 Tax=Mobilicoccus pelagius TaxID=746032 RepID=UPI001FE1623D|nr:MFS transporter [Mobilicoccus pelagius]